MWGYWSTQDGQATCGFYPTPLCHRGSILYFNYPSFLRGKNTFSPSPPSIPSHHLCPSSFIERSVYTEEATEKTMNFCFPIVPNDEALISLMEEWVPSPVPSTFPLWPEEKQVTGQRLYTLLPYLWVLWSECVSPKLTVIVLNLKDDDFTGWGLWEVLKSQGYKRGSRKTPSTIWEHYEPGR